MKKPSKTVSVQLPKEDVEALESLIGETLNWEGETFVIKRLSDSMRYAMLEVVAWRKDLIEVERNKAEKAAAAKAKREAKKAEANGI